MVFASVLPVCFQMFVCFHCVSTVFCASLSQNGGFPGRAVFEFICMSLQ